MALLGMVTIRRDIVEDSMLRRGLYRHEFAKQAGLSGATLAKALKQVPVSVGTARAIAEALNISLRSIIAETHSRGADFAIAVSEPFALARAIKEGRNFNPDGTVKRNPDGTLKDESEGTLLG